MSYRKLKRKNHAIKDIQTSQYLNDGLVHVLANKHQQIKVINWDGTVQQIKNLLGANNELITHALMIDKDGQAHFTNDLETTEPVDNYVYQSVDLHDYRIRLAKNTLLIHQIDYQSPFYESKITWINERHLKTKYPHLIQ